MAERDQEPKSSSLGRFIQTYHSFLSTFVIGAAGLVATSIWQYRQSEIAARQAESQQRIAAVQAENNWRIERAEILSKNLDVLSSSGPETVEQRYGLLLSLTRGNILDPELAVSNALELGKDSPAYMKSVLLSTSERATHASPAPESCLASSASASPATCRYARRKSRRALPGAERSVRRGGRGRARKKQPGPTELLMDEHTVQTMPLKLTALFGTYLSELFERRQKPEIDQFEAISPGAHLISALVLAPTQPNSFVAASEAAQIEQFHKDRSEWIRSYLYGASCNGECKGKLIDVLLTWYAEAEGRYDDALKEPFTRPLSSRPRRARGGARAGRPAVRLRSCTSRSRCTPASARSRPPGSWRPER